ncbi:hypothetical protein NC651_006537 [Populus alba x Populus x berolinensis]|nr:hypothetical protein NC651_006537 [Populus alba x Populus x berolinensis]
MAPSPATHFEKQYVPHFQKYINS